jgi:hypothetical protein
VICITSDDLRLTRKIRRTLAVGAHDHSRDAAEHLSDWPNAAADVGADAYTMRHSDGRFIYVGMSGRSITRETVAREKPHGLCTQLHSLGRSVFFSAARRRHGMIRSALTR